ncbi:aminotransferase class I/II-fold pyridoxal phosphate-dependent enzyme [soil metagenome]
MAPLANRRIDPRGIFRMRLSQRRSLINSSGIRKIFDLASTMKNPINLSIGLPDFDVPDAVKECAIAAIRGGKNRYTLTAGTPQLREAVREYYRKRDVPFDDVLIASGTSGGLFLVFLALLDPGDEVLILDPYFVMYEALVKFIGAKPVLVDTYPDFKITREALEKAATPKTKLLILNSPSNPTGHVYTEAECRIAAEFAESRGIEVLSDEIYEPFCYDGDFVSPAKFFKAPITISGLSKSVGMTGWRVGWVAGPSDLMKAITDIQQYTFVCAPSFAQEAAIEGLKHDMRATNDDYRKRRDLIYGGLVDAGYNVEKPGGAFYIFPEAPGGDGDAFVLDAIKNNLLIVPGSVFSARKSHFRISFAAAPDTLRAGIGVLAKLAAQYKG